MNRVKELEKFGQSIWLDFLSREFIEKGEIQRLVKEDGLKGMTSNPSIFEKAIGHSEIYDKELAELVRGHDADVGRIFTRLAVTDIGAAADALRPVFDETRGSDGFISLEVSPYLARDTEGTIAEARTLWGMVERPNLMIKVPGTPEGLPAIRTLIGEGINVNITLLFALSAYEEVVEAYLSGLEAHQGDLSGINSVASFFLSRIDTKADNAIDEKLKAASTADRLLLDHLKGKTAIASAKLAYLSFHRLFAGPRWEKLAARGAKKQRLLWASTGTKNKAYSDVLYIETLIGPDTVNTVPPATLDAFRDHGKAAATLETGIEEAQRNLRDLKRVGISLEGITDELVAEGVTLFAEAADQLYGAVAKKREALLKDELALVSLTLGEAEGKAVDAALKKWTADGKLRRLWQHDKDVWTGTDENKWLGWLDIVEREQADAQSLRAFAQSVQSVGHSDVVLLGMGGSSLGPDVIARSFGRQPGWPRFHMLDSTDPDQIRAIESAVDVKKTLFIVSSKSGSTLEPNILKDYFLDRVTKVARAEDAGKQFVAVTDPGSAMEKVARDAGFADIFHGDPAIGGRYSVLSKFGLVPAAAIGIDVERLLASTRHMVLSCGPLAPPAANPGVRLGIALGVLATKFKRDKVTILASPKLASLGAWLEQLIAESTGKQGRGLIPVDAEPAADPARYEADRVFLHVALEGDGASEGLARAGHPVLRIDMPDIAQLGQVFYLAEMAIAVAGAVIGIDPFNQPDVEASKIKTRELTDEYERSGKLAAEKPLFAADGVELFADAENASALGRADSLAGYLKAHLDRAQAGDYVALLAFIARNGEHTEILQTMRRRILEGKRVATCLGFGPRFLHSTGQAYKGGPNSGVFVQITCDPSNDLAVPGKRYSFGTVELAQAQGDLAVLNERKRRALRIHLKDVERGLDTLSRAVADALR